MRLKSVSLRGFRNLQDGVIEVPPDGVAIVGRNAQGKSNFLEAIAYLETFRSFRGTGDDRLVRFGEKIFRLVGELDGADDSGGTRTVSAAFESGSRTKRVTVDDRVPDRIGDAIGNLGTVLFTPSDVRLVSDGPVERRRFLDILLSLNDRGYLKALQRFRQTLAQRNAALRAGEGPVEAWDEALVRWGSEVSRSRASWVREIQPVFGETFREVFQSAGARLEYEASVPDADEASEAEELAMSFRRALERGRASERRRGMTLVGPHRDEMRVFIQSDGDAEVDVREFGSGGQRRTAALALRLAEAETLRRRRGREPILLLDDVFAELDEDRSRSLLRLLDRLVPGQVILTAPKEADVRFREEVLPRWSIEAGEISG